jgi:hypothetical protein
MNKMDWFILCPVPRDQRPFYEYIKRKDSSILGWVGLNEFNYKLRFFITLGGIFTLILPFTSWFINLSYYPVQTLLVNLLISLTFQSLLYGYFFVTWVYAGKRLVAAKVWYEESGWYDGRVWIKPPSILRHERLLYHYQLLPLIKRLAKTLQFLVLAGVIVFSLIFLFV